MDLIKMFTGNHSEIQEKVREEAMFVFEQDIEKCTLFGNRILDNFHIEASISNTLNSLKEEPLQQKSMLSELQYNKILDEVATEVRSSYLR